MIAIVLGIIPPVIIRYVILKKALSWKVALVVALVMLVITAAILDNSSISQTMTAYYSGAVGALTFFILKWK